MEGLSISEKNLSLSEEAQALIIDLLYAYHYEKRLTSFSTEESSESALNMLKLSSFLSAFVNFQEAKTFDMKIRAVIISSIRRTLVFSFIRNYDLSLKVMEDMISHSLNNKKKMIHSLNEIHRIFEQSKLNAFNLCYIDDLIKYAELHISEGEVKFLASKVLAVISNMKKHMLGLDLDEVDQMA